MPAIASAALSSVSASTSYDVHSVSTNVTDMSVAREVVAHAGQVANGFGERVRDFGDLDPLVVHALGFVEVPVAHRHQARRVEAVQEQSTRVVDRVDDALRLRVLIGPGAEGEVDRTEQNRGLQSVRVRDVDILLVDVEREQVDVAKPERV